MCFIIIALAILVAFSILLSIFKRTINIIKRRRIKKYFQSTVVRVNYTIDNKKNIYKDVTKKDLEEFNTENIEALKDDLYDKFYRFEVAYNSLDYNMMKMLSTTQLYNNYYTGISLDLKVGEKRIIDDVQRKSVILYEVNSTIAKQTASLLIEVSYINYRIDKDGNVISGERFKPVTEKFEVVFRKDFQKEENVKCPNCGANIVGNKCEYCRTAIKDSDFKISSIKRVID